MFGDEGWNLPHDCAQGFESGDGALVRQFVNVQSIGGSLERSPQTIERQISFGQDFAARLELAQRAQDYLLGVNRGLIVPLIEKCRLAHGRKRQR
jgi:hypothetical protein